MGKNKVPCSSWPTLYILMRNILLLAKTLLRNEVCLFVEYSTVFFYSR